MNLRVGFGWPVGDEVNGWVGEGDGTRVNKGKQALPQNDAEQWVLVVHRVDKSVISQLSS